MSRNELPRDVVDVVVSIAKALDDMRHEYAFGGAVALAYWATPRGTVDADLTIYLPPDEPEQCIAVLQDLDCSFLPLDATLSLKDHGFCRVSYGGFQLDVFLPTFAFYEKALHRRQSVMLEGTSIKIWDPETLCVFKMMFFRLKDLADVEAILAMQGAKLDRNWVAQQLTSIHGERDPRVNRWAELAGQP